MISPSKRWNSRKPAANQVVVSSRRPTPRASLSNHGAKPACHWASSRPASLPGNSFGPQPEWDVQVEQNFAFELTADQQTALKETFKDLEAANPADRLISGDVGFGKTEVALRAAHRVVGHGKQVAILVPTTLLAEIGRAHV